MEPVAQGLRERKKLQTRLALARAAMRLFEERGYAATTIDDIAAEANVSRRTFFRYFASKEEAFLVDPAGKLEALHVALAEGPPDEPTIAALRRGILALTEAYFEPDIVRATERISHREPAILAAAMAYQVHWEDELSREVAVDLGVDGARRSTSAHRGSRHGGHHAGRRGCLAPGRNPGRRRRTSSRPPSTVPSRRSKPSWRCPRAERRRCLVRTPAFALGQRRIRRRGHDLLYSPRGSLKRAGSRVGSGADTRI